MQPRIFLADAHEIDPNLIDVDAVFALQRLSEAGYIAYLVGGGVRDLLLKQRPKDYDISTSASPEQIRRLFGKQCLLIGRRFRLAHLRFGKKVFEVSTFRSGESSDDLIVRDNQWGTPEEDAIRRDFTMNGLFFDPTHHHVIDYVGGWEDIHKRVLRTIGDPIVRFRQDPVRMLRLIKFIARFGFSVDQETARALDLCRLEICKSSAARILEELLRMLDSGFSVPFFLQLKEQGLLAPLLPWFAQILQKKALGDEVIALLSLVDEKTRDTGTPLDRSLTSACWLFPTIERELRLHYYDKGRVPSFHDVTVVVRALIRGVENHSFPPFTRKMKATWESILLMQYQMVPFPKRPSSVHHVVSHGNFPLALQFLQLRACIDPSLSDVLHHWEDESALFEQEGHERHLPEEEEHHGHKRKYRRYRGPR